MKIYSAFNDSVQKFFHHTAIQMDGESVTYESLDGFINLVCDQLKAQGVAKGDIIGVYTHPGIEYIAAILAINKVDAVFMPLEPSTPPKRMELMLGTATPCLFITHHTVVSSLMEMIKADAGFSSKLLMIDYGQMAAEWAMDNKEHTRPQPQPTSDLPQSCYLFFTSGSTGTPKAIDGTEDGLDHFIRWEIAEFGIKSDTKVSLLAPLSFDVSLRDIFVPLYAGGTLCIPPLDTKRHIEALIKWFAGTGVNHIHMVPSLLRLITAEVQSSIRLRQAFSAVNYILLAGEPLFYKDVLSWRKSLEPAPQLVNLYGPSETTLAKLFFRIGEIVGKEMEIVPLGYSIPGARVQVLKDGRDCQIGEIGEVCIKTRYRSKGYYGDESLTAQKFIPTDQEDGYGDVLYKSGDLAKYLSDGAIQFIGRQDNQVKINGNRVEISEVEGVLNSYPLIDQAIVTALNNAQQEPELAGYYIASIDVDHEALKRHLAETLPAYMHPAYFIRMEKFPLNINGKIDRKALPLPVVKTDQKNYEPCETDIEERIEVIWKDILKVDQIGRNTSFFALGGSSLKAIRIISRIQKEFNVLIKLTSFFAKPMVKDLAEQINTASASLDKQKILQ